MNYRLKSIKNISFVVSLLLLCGISTSVMLMHNNQTQQSSAIVIPNLITKINLQQALFEPSLELADFPHLIKQEENQLWHQLANIGINKEDYEKSCILYKDIYDASIETMRKKYTNENTPLSPETIMLVHKIMDEFGIDKNAVEILSSNLPSMGASTDSLLWINEYILTNTTTKDSKKFAIAHECTHIKNKDHSTRFFIKKHV